MKFRIIYDDLGTEKGYSTFITSQADLDEKLRRLNITPQNIKSIKVNDEPVEVKELVESGVLK